MIKKKRIFATNKLNEVLKSKYIIICIGTPITKKFSPNTNNFINFFYQLKKYTNKFDIAPLKVKHDRAIPNCRFDNPM